VTPFRLPISGMPTASRARPSRLRQCRDVPAGQARAGEIGG
jgi:hypothetical protein